jgi:hypothetical protein
MAVEILAQYKKRNHAPLASASLSHSLRFAPFRRSTTVSGFASLLFFFLFEKLQRLGRERKNRNTSKWQLLQRVHFSGTRGRGATHSVLPRPRLRHLLRTPRLSLANSSKNVFSFSCAPVDGSSNPASYMEFSHNLTWQNQLTALGKRAFGFAKWALWKTWCIN